MHEAVLILQFNPTSFLFSFILLSSVMSSQILNSAFMAPHGILGGRIQANLGGQVPYDGAFFPYQRNATVVDSVPNEILHMIHDHWYQFPPMNPLWHSILGIAMIVLGIVSVIGNGMVVYLMTSTKVKNLFAIISRIKFLFPQDLVISFVICYITTQFEISLFKGTVYTGYL